MYNTYLKHKNHGIILRNVFNPENKCLCFPDANTLEEQYYDYMTKEHMSYLGEKTLPTISRYLAGKKGLHNVSLVPIYAISDYMKDMCSPEAVGCIDAKVAKDLFLRMVNSAVKYISRPCKC